MSEKSKSRLNVFYLFLFVSVYQNLCQSIFVSLFIWVFVCLFSYHVFFTMLYVQGDPKKTEPTFTAINPELFIMLLHYGKIFLTNVYKISILYFKFQEFYSIFTKRSEKRH